MVHEVFIACVATWSGTCGGCDLCCLHLSVFGQDAVCCKYHTYHDSGVS